MKTKTRGRPQKKPYSKSKSTTFSANVGTLRTFKAQLKREGKKFSEELNNLINNYLNQNKQDEKTD
jgi:hypothetical protein